MEPATENDIKKLEDRLEKEIKDVEKIVKENNRLLDKLLDFVQDMKRGFIR